jgi:2-polyprenyl-6-methoxyphenol hydroxylase-like FAD-dependent oxidoreductase
LGLHRAVLFHELVSKAQSYPNIEISYGSTITNAHVEHTETELVSRVVNSSQSTAGSFLVDEKGNLEGPFDMLIFADGRQSIRAQMPIDKYVWESWYKFGCFWALLPDKEKAFVGDRTLSQVYDGCDVMLGLLPTGRTPTMKPSEAQLVSLFWSVEVAAVERIKAQGLGSWKAQVIELQPRCEKLLESVRTWDDLIVAKYSDTIMPHFDFGNAVFIGDSAHATSPQLGQGANLALVDAWKLSEAMKMSGMNGASSSVQEALAAYNRDRRWRLWFYQMNSKLLTPVFQSNSRLIGAARDTLMGPLCQFEPTKLQMLTTLIGAQNNLMPYSTIPKEEFMGFVEGVPEDMES